MGYYPCSIFFYFFGVTLFHGWVPSPCVFPGFFFPFFSFLFFMEQRDRWYPHQLPLFVAPCFQLDRGQLRGRGSCPSLYHLLSFLPLSFISASLGAIVHGARRPFFGFHTLRVSSLSFFVGAPGPSPTRFFLVAASMTLKRSSVLARDISLSPHDRRLHLPPPLFFAGLSFVVLFFSPLSHRPLTPLLPLHSMWIFSVLFRALLTLVFLHFEEIVFFFRSRYLFYLVVLSSLPT